MHQPYLVIIVLQTCNELGIVIAKMETTFFSESGTLFSLQLFVTSYVVTQEHGDSVMRKRSAVHGSHHHLSEVISTRETVAWFKFITGFKGYITVDVSIVKKSYCCSVSTRAKTFQKSYCCSVSTRAKTSQKSQLNHTNTLR